MFIFVYTAGSPSWKSLNQSEVSSPFSLWAHDAHERAVCGAKKGIHRTRRKIDSAEGTSVVFACSV